MLDVLMVLAIIVLSLLTIGIVGAVAILAWALGYTVYCAIKGRPNPFAEHKQMFDTDEESK